MEQLKSGVIKILERIDQIEQEWKNSFEEARLKLREIAAQNTNNWHDSTTIHESKKQKFLTDPVVNADEDYSLSEFNKSNRAAKVKAAAKLRETLKAKSLTVKVERLSNKKIAEISQNLSVAHNNENGINKADDKLLSNLQQVGKNSAFKRSACLRSQGVENNSDSSILEIVSLHQTSILSLSENESIAEIQNQSHQVQDTNNLNGSNVSTSRKTRSRTRKATNISAVNNKDTPKKTKHSQPSTAFSNQNNYAVATEQQNDDHGNITSNNSSPKTNEKQLNNEDEATFVVQKGEKRSVLISIENTTHQIDNTTIPRNDTFVVSAAGSEDAPAQSLTDNTKQHKNCDNKENNITLVKLKSKRILDKEDEKITRAKTDKKRQPGKPNILKASVTTLGVQPPKIKTSNYGKPNLGAFPKTSPSNYESLHNMNTMCHSTPPNRKIAVGQNVNKVHNTNKINTIKPNTKEGSKNGREIVRLKKEEIFQQEKFKKPPISKHNVLKLPPKILEENLDDIENKDCECNSEKLIERKKWKNINQSNTTAKTKETVNTYGFDMLHTDDENEENGNSNMQPPIWSRPRVREFYFEEQNHLPVSIVDNFFSTQPLNPDLQEMFPTIHPKYLKRNSSIVWKTPPRYSELPKY